MPDHQAACRIEHGNSGTQKIANRVAVDTLAHITEQANRFHRAVGNQRPGTGVQLVVDQRSYKGIVFVDRMPAGFLDLGFEQYILNGRADRQGEGLAMDRHLNLFHG